MQEVNNNFPKEDKNQSWVFGELKGYDIDSNLNCRVEVMI